MRPGVCTAPEPAPERDRPSEGYQLLVQDSPNYVDDKRQGDTWRVLFDASWFLIPPPHRRQGSLPRPHFIQRSAVVQSPVLHHVANLLGVVDVVERVRVQHHEIAELAGLERAQ